MTSKNSDDAEAFLPLTPATFYVLLALADGERHGYAILRDVQDRSRGGVRLGAGTLYGILQRLLAEGLVMESNERPGSFLDDPRRRYCRLTDLGRRVAEAEAARLEAVLNMARTKSLLPNRFR